MPEWMQAVSLTPAWSQVQNAQIAIAMASFCLYISWMLKAPYKRDVQGLGALFLMVWGFLGYTVVRDDEYQWTGLMLIRMMLLSFVPAPLILGIGGGFLLLFRRR